MISGILSSEIIKCLLAQHWPAETSALLGLGIGTAKGLFPCGSQCSAVSFGRERGMQGVSSELGFAILLQWQGTAEGRFTLLYYLILVNDKISNS